MRSKFEIELDELLILIQQPTFDMTGDRIDVLATIHGTIEYQVGLGKIKEVDKFLLAIKDLDIELSYLIGIVIRTQAIKDKLLNREDIFLKTEQLGIIKYGKEKLEKSVFYNIK